MLKPYKNQSSNDKVRDCVRRFNAFWQEHGSVTWKYCSRNEKILDIMHWLNLKPTEKGLATRVYEIIVADGAHDKIVQNMYGWNQYTA